MYHFFGLFSRLEFSFVTRRVYNVSRLDERYEIAYEPTWVEI